MCVWGGLHYFNYVFPLSSTSVQISIQKKSRSFEQKHKENEKDLIYFLI